jgi:hypothetical protein
MNTLLKINNTKIIKGANKLYGRVDVRYPIALSASSMQIGTYLPY